ncbi:uncharacterized protein LOC106667754 [Cimex lectularius]|uniref:Uncharacterized protein n=1 Tax=Cimex lectularius TaxID=79782 RepID=A0A8I6RRW5_CIMLE|nr:uncharacterized protein LOC106667754 [Cimex lectularius]
MTSDNFNAKHGLVEFKSLFKPQDLKRMCPERKKEKVEDECVHTLSSQIISLISSFKNPGINSNSKLEPAAHEFKVAKMKNNLLANNNDTSKESYLNENTAKFLELIKENNDLKAENKKLKLELNEWASWYEDLKKTLSSFPSVEEFNNKIRTDNKLTKMLIESQKKLRAAHMVISSLNQTKNDLETKLNKASGETVKCTCMTQSKYFNNNATLSSSSQYTLTCHHSRDSEKEFIKSSCEQSESTSEELLIEQESSINISSNNLESSNCQCQSDSSVSWLEVSDKSKNSTEQLSRQHRPCDTSTSSTRFTQDDTFLKTDAPAVKAEVMKIMKERGITKKKYLQELTQGKNRMFEKIKTIELTQERLENELNGYKMEFCDIQDEIATLRSEDHIKHDKQITSLITNQKKLTNMIYENEKQIELISSKRKNCLKSYFCMNQFIEFLQGMKC